MGWQGLFSDALPLVVALLTILTAGGGIGLWLGILTSRQKQTQANLERLEGNFNELLAGSDFSIAARVERIQQFLRSTESGED